MSILNYLWYVLKCMGAITGILLLLNICLTVIQNYKIQKQKNTIQIEMLLQELANQKENKDK